MRFAEPTLLCPPAPPPGTLETPLPVEATTRGGGLQKQQLSRVSVRLRGNCSHRAPNPFVPRYLEVGGSQMAENSVAPPSPLESV